MMFSDFALLACCTILAGTATKATTPANYGYNDDACTTALHSACGTLTGLDFTAACDGCVLFHVVPLTTSGCSTPQVAAYCSNATKPPLTAPPKCQAALKTACGKEQPKGNFACMLCVYASKKAGSTLEAAGCNYTTEAEFCAGPLVQPVPRPPPPLPPPPPPPPPPPAPPGPEPPAPPVVPYPYAYPHAAVWDGRALLRGRAAALAGNLNKTLLAALVAVADSKLDQVPISVLNKSYVPPSGDMHDFVAIASYATPCTTKCNASLEPFNCSQYCTPLIQECNWTKYWMLYGWQCNGGHHGLAPNGGNTPSDFCNEKTGLPWVMHDGYSGSTYNPIMRTLDRAKVDALWDAANPLALAYWFTNERKYLEKASALFRTFFLDSKTRMNPNLNYAVLEPGCKMCNDGTNDPAKCGWGGTVQLARLRYALSAISLLEAGDQDGAVWTADDRRGMREWIGNLTTWWLDSYLGRSAHARQNNIGLAYSVVGISMALYADQPNTATMLANADVPRHLAQQITPAGELPNEDAPHDLFSFGYHVGDLIMLFEMVYVANQTAGLGIDPFTYHTNISGSLITAIEWVAPYCTGQAPWPIGPVSPLGGQDAECVILFRMAANVLHSRKYEAVSRNSTSKPNTEFCYGMDARMFMDMIAPSIFANGGHVEGNSTA